MQDSSSDTAEKSNHKDIFTVEIGTSDEDHIVRYIKFNPNNTFETKDQQDDATTDEASAGNDVKGSEHDRLYHTTFENLLNFWAQSSLGFLDVFPLFASVPHYVNHRASGMELIKFLENEALDKESSKKEDDELKYTVYRLGRQHLDYVHRQIQKRRQFESAEEALSKAQLLAVIAEYEAFIADLLKLAIKEFPESFIPSSHTVNASTIIRGADLEQVKASIIEDHVTDLQRGSHVEVIKTIFKQLKLPQPDDKALREFGEICSRRNTLTHANGVANKVYRSELRKIGVPEEEIPTEGERLPVDNLYMRRSIARVFQMGYFIGHQVWQHLRKDEHNESVKLIINHSHDFLVSKYTKISGRLCEFGLNKKSPADEKEKAYLTINLALSYLLNEKLGEAEKKEGIEKALSKRDWSIVDSKFSMALCCIYEEYDKFGDLFDAVKDRDFDINEFMSLAIFSKARKQPIFKEKMLEHYGVVIRVEDVDEEDDMRKDD